MTPLTQKMIPVFCAALFLFTAATGWADAEANHIRFNAKRVSANLNQIPLSVVLEKISHERKFWFSGGEEPLSNAVSVHFQDLPFEAAIKRILAKTNYSLISNGHGVPIGAIVLGLKTADATSTKHGPVVQTEVFVDSDHPQIAEQVMPPEIDSPVTIDDNEMKKMMQMAKEAGDQMDTPLPVLAGMPEEFAAYLSSTER